MRVAWALILVACGSQGADIDEDTGEGGTFDPPDVAGAYGSTLSAIEGCDGLAPPIDALEGPVEITQEGDALTFTWSEVALTGAIDASFTWTIADSAVVDAWALDVSAEGLAYSEGDRWVLEGDLTVEVADPGGATCSLVAHLVVTGNET